MKSQTNPQTNPMLVEKTILGLPIPTHRVSRVLYRHLLTWWRNYFFSSLVGTVGEAILYLFSLGLGMAHYIGVVNGIPYIEYLAAGIWMSSSMYAASFDSTFGTFTRYHEQKTFDGILCTPIQLDEIIAAEVVYAGTHGLLSATIIGVIFTLFGLIHTPLAILIIPLGFLTGVAFSSLSLIGAAIAKNYSFFSYYFTIGITPMFLLSGIFFPLNQLPEWASKIAWFTPLYHAVLISRELYQGIFSLNILFSVIWLTLFSLICFYIAVFAFRKKLLK